MLKTPRALGAMTTAPHHLASRAGLEVLRDGGNAAEAMIAMAATIAVVYPHMNSIGGDGFWLMARPGEAPTGIQACGPAAARATPRFYKDAGYGLSLPDRGGPSALTVAGTVGGWTRALEIARRWGGRKPLGELLDEAIRQARRGVVAVESLERLTREKLAELRDVPGFAETFLVDGEPPREGSRLRFDRLGATLEHLAKAGLDDFYRGDVARAMARDLENAGSPLRLSDLQAYGARQVEPLSVGVKDARAFNLPPPTQGVASLMILAILDRLGPSAGESFQFVHDAVEATKQAFLVRDANVSDPAHMPVEAASLLQDDKISRAVSAIDRSAALPWPQTQRQGDTIWMGAIDESGCAVSFIQSLYWEFGSGVVSSETGVLWQNRGVSFSLDPGHPNRLAPGRLPFHTLNPALALFGDGRTMVYGTIGGEGQPQTQAAVFARYAWLASGLQEAVTAPRWLLGRTWGEESTTLKLESRFDADVVAKLRSAGHEVELVDAFSDLMGHAGALVRHADGLLEGAADPRSDGQVAAY